MSGSAGLYSLKIHNPLVWIQWITTINIHNTDRHTLTPITYPPIVAGAMAGIGIGMLLAGLGFIAANVIQMFRRGLRSDETAETSLL